jgi:hypothetical protein
LRRRFYELAAGGAAPLASEALTRINTLEGDRDAHPWKHFGRRVR